MKRDRDGFIIALRVLARTVYGEEASPRDINALRRNAGADEIDLPIYDLCCRVLERALCGPEKPVALTLKLPDSPSGSGR